MSDAYTFVKRRRIGSSSGRLVLISIAEFSDEGGSCAPSMKRIAEDTELSVRTVVAAINLLVEKGIVTRARQADCKGHRLADKITLVGFAEFLISLKALESKEKSLSAKYARADGAQVQKPHVRDFHLGDETQDVVTRIAPRSIPSDAELALRDEFAPLKKEISPTPPIRTLSEAKASSREAPPKRAARITTDWSPHLDTSAYATRIGFAAWEIDALAFEFREYWLGRTDKGAARAGWDPTFKKRLRDIAENPRERAKLKLIETGPLLQLGVSAQTAFFDDKNAVMILQGLMDGTITPAETRSPLPGEPGSKFSPAAVRLSKWNRARLTAPSSKPLQAEMGL